MERTCRLTSSPIRVGTSGWSYPHWRKVFYPQGLGASQWLRYYAQRFSTVEINATFYRLPSETTVQKWASGVPEGFLYAVKLSRIITHRRKLLDTEEPLKVFLQRVRLLADHLGPVLVQLPPRWKRNLSRLEAFLSSMPGDLMVAVEFRDPSWFHPEVYDFLHRVGAAFCRHDMQGLSVPAVNTGPFRYIRLHGPSGPYAGSYSHAELERWAAEILSDPGDEGTFVYFNNDVGGHAPINALQLMEILDRLA